MLVSSNWNHKSLCSGLVWERAFPVVVSSAWKFSQKIPEKVSSYHSNLIFIMWLFLNQPLSRRSIMLRPRMLRSVPQEANSETVYVQEVCRGMPSNQCLLRREGSQIGQRKELNDKLNQFPGGSLELSLLFRSVLPHIKTPQLYTFTLTSHWMWANSRIIVWPWAKWLFLACLFRATPSEGLSWGHNTNTPSSWGDGCFSPQVGGSGRTTQNRFHFIYWIFCIHFLYNMFWEKLLQNSDWSVFLELTKGRSPVGMNCCPFEGGTYWIKSARQQPSG